MLVTPRPASPLLPFHPLARRAFVGQMFVLLFCAAGYACSVQDGSSMVMRDIADTVFAKCGDSYFRFSGGNTMTEWKDVDIKVESEELTAADRLNGFQFKGSGELIGSPCRKYTNIGSYWTERAPWHWDKWRDKCTIHFSLKRFNDQWYVHSLVFHRADLEAPALQSFLAAQKRPECTAIPQ